MAKHLTEADFRATGKNFLRMVGRFGLGIDETKPIARASYSSRFTPEALSRLEWHLHQLWEVFDKGELLPSTELAAAAADQSFQRFLREQCLKGESSHG